ncbi:MAG: Holliday junction branch migration protein RuvA [Desulfomonilaceae bacterium]
MIACLRGKIISRGINRVVVDVQGVGYDVAVSLTTLEALPLDGEAFLHIHTALRENSLELYGFSSSEEKILFEMLISISGIGPRTSLNILSGIPPDSFRLAVLDSDVQKLSSIPGIGKKSAQRIVLELKEKLKKSQLMNRGVPITGYVSDLKSDLVSSLINLGYKEKLAESLASDIVKENGADIDLESALKIALKKLIA